MFSFRTTGLRQPISAPVPLYARPAGHSDQRPLSDRYLAAPVAVGVRVARHGEGPDPAARRTAFLCAVRRPGSGGADAADRGEEDARARKLYGVDFGRHGNRRAAPLDRTSGV